VKLNLENVINAYGGNVGCRKKAIGKAASLSSGVKASAKIEEISINERQNQQQLAAKSNGGAGGGVMKIGVMALAAYAKAAIIENAKANRRKRSGIANSAKI